MTGPLTRQPRIGQAENPRSEPQTGPSPSWPRLHVDGRVIELDRNGRAQVEGYLVEPGVADFWGVRRPGEKRSYLFLSSKHPTTTIEASDGRQLTVELELPFAFTQGERTAIHARTTSDPAFMAWERQLDMHASSALARVGDRVLAHGVERDKGGMRNLLGIAISGLGRETYIGRLTNGRSEWTSGAHGPYFVTVGNRGHDGRWQIQAYVLPNSPRSKVYWRRLLDEALENGAMTAERRDEILRATFTHDEFAKVVRER